MKPAWRLLNWPTATLERIRGRNCVDVQTLELKRFSVVLSPSYSTQSNSLSQCPPGTQVPTTNDHGFPSKESSQGGAPSYVCGFKTPFTNPLYPFTCKLYLPENIQKPKLLEGGTIQKRWGTIQKYFYGWNMLELGLNPPWWPRTDLRFTNFFSFWLSGCPLKAPGGPFFR